VFFSLIIIEEWSPDQPSCLVKVAENYFLLQQTMYNLKNSIAVRRWDSILI